MKRQILNFVIDTAALLVMLAMVATGFLLKWILPPGSRGGQGLQLWGMTRHDWGDLHFWLAVALLLLMFVHVLLHWSWVCALVARLVRGTSSGGAVVAHSRQWLYGISFLIVCCLLVAAFLWLASAHTRRGGGSEERGHGGFRGGRGAAVSNVLAPNG
jgi:hypothetical protein